MPGQSRVSQDQRLWRGRHGIEHLIEGVTVTDGLERSVEDFVRAKQCGLRKRDEGDGFAGKLEADAGARFEEAKEEVRGDWLRSECHGCWRVGGIMLNQGAGEGGEIGDHCIKWTECEYDCIHRSGGIGLNVQRQFPTEVPPNREDGLEGRVGKNPGRGGNQHAAGFHHGITEMRRFEGGDRQSQVNPPRIGRKGFETGR